MQTLYAGLLCHGAKRFETLSAGTVKVRYFFCYLLYLHLGALRDDVKGESWRVRYSLFLIWSMTQFIHTAWVLVSTQCALENGVVSKVNKLASYFRNQDALINFLKLVSIKVFSQGLGEPNTIGICSVLCQGSPWSGLRSDCGWWCLCCWPAGDPFAGIGKSGEIGRYPLQWTVNAVTYPPYVLVVSCLVDRLWISWSIMSRRNGVESLA